MAERFWLSDEQWAVVELLLPRLGGKPRVDDRRVISGILNRYREGLRWRAVPAGYGPRTTLFNRFNRWSEKGIWQGLLAALVACKEPPTWRWSIALPFARIDRLRVQKGAAESGDRPIARRIDNQTPRAGGWRRPPRRPNADGG